MTDEVYKLLYSPRRTAAKIELKKSHILALEQSMLPSGIRYDTDKVQSSPSDPMLKYVEKLEKLKEDLKTLQIRYDKELQNLVDAINLVEEPNEVETLINHFIRGESCEHQAERIHYSESAVYTWQRNGIYHMQEALKRLQ